MPLIEWTDRMSVGVEALDSDHQRLIGLLNQLDAIIQGTESEAALPGLVHELVRYTTYHFASEERMMRLARYPGLDEHLRAHTDLRRRIVSFEQKFLTAPGTAADAVPLFEFLSEWLTRHILQEDMRYRPYMVKESA
ncbi:bacteriohemerythrin [Roseospira navarrensis]|uniref:Bacteriohemerythrin n=1 Tax=Roseospira navarrensis TaxID=140058 RepID=A0A7X1ZDH9_9PROT|nr:bacteriohemerythrin [Roseospira navarrensis]MQX36536.1 bacteriohemerythrin [Roseospira navarrensis]